MTDTIPIYTIDVDEFPGDIFFIDLPAELNFDSSLLANSAESVEEIAREKIAELTGQRLSEFGLRIEWSKV